jgi:hypothetical protein
MQNAPTNVDMEKVWKVVSEDVITRRKDDRPQCLEDEDVEMTIKKKPLHQ